MKKVFGIGIVSLLVIGALAALVAGSAFAQEETPQPETNPPALGFGRGFRGDGPGFEAAAEALGMTTDELSTQLWGGKTLADLAEEKGVALADVQAAVEAAQQDALRERIQAAADAGTITQEHADWLLEGLDQGFWGGRAGGFFFGGPGGPGRHGGRGGFGLPQDAPPAAPTSTGMST